MAKKGESHERNWIFSDSNPEQPHKDYVKEKSQVKTKY